MEENRFRHTSRVTTEGLRHIKSTARADELQIKITDAAKDENKAESPFNVGVQYLMDGFKGQADGLRSLSGLNNAEDRRHRSIPLLQRRKAILNSLQTALQSESFTELERDNLRWLYDMGSAFSNYISKNLGIFDSQYGMTRQMGAMISSVTAAETQQCLAEMLVSAPREASDVASVEESRGGARYLEETAFSLFHTMAVRAMGLEAGTGLYNNMQTGVYGLAAAYISYSDPALNRFGKSFRVLFPPPHLDALEQTDLLLIDEEGLTSEARKEIMGALESGLGREYDAINRISGAAKEHVYKVQVKSSFNGRSHPTSQDIEDRERFASARCTSKGFDNYDYLVLNDAQARRIVQANRKDSENDKRQ